jgi:hypothetical protein
MLVPYRETAVYVLVFHSTRPMTFFTVLTVLNNFNKRCKLMQKKDTLYIILPADMAEINVIVTRIVLNYHIFEWGKLLTHGKTMVLANDEITKTDLVCLLEY